MINWHAVGTALLALILVAAALYLGWSSLDLFIALFNAST